MYPISVERVPGDYGDEIEITQEFSEETDRIVIHPDQVSLLIEWLQNISAEIQRERADSKDGK
jgi:hypothetical protein